MVNSLVTFRVRIGDACNHFDEVSVIIDPPSGGAQSLLPAITPSPGGFVVRYTPHETGTYSVRVLLNSCLITGAPFKVEVLPTPLLPTPLFPSGPFFPEDGFSTLPQLLQMASEEDLLPTADELLAVQVRAFGPGLRDGMTAHHVAEFIVDLKPVLTGVNSGCSAGRVQVIVDGPTEAKIHCKDNQDKTCSVAYLPTSPGLYSVSVLYNGYHINQSPFAVNITEDCEAAASRTRSPLLKPTASFRRR